MRIAESELIINEDGTIYHLNLKPGDLSTCIITVGDQNRVDKVASYFDSIELTVQKREFKTITGLYKGKRLSIISTGIGTDNIDIVFNEIDALFNIDFNSRQIRDELTQLEFIRIGTSGVLRSEIPVDSLLISNAAIGTEGLLNFYEFEASSDLKQIDAGTDNVHCYYAAADQGLVEHFQDEGILNGITVTANGFYGPQMRAVRLKPKSNDWLEKLQALDFSPLQITNLEMETAGIYAMARLLGHKAISINALLANRKEGIFSTQATNTESKMIEWSLEKVLTI